MYWFPISNKTSWYGLGLWLVIHSSDCKTSDDLFQRFRMTSLKISISIMTSLKISMSKLTSPLLFWSIVLGLDWFGLVYQSMEFVHTHAMIDFNEMEIFENVHRNSWVVLRYFTVCNNQSKYCFFDFNLQLNTLNDWVFVDITGNV